MVHDRTVSHPGAREDGSQGAVSTLKDGPAGAAAAAIGAQEEGGAAMTVMAMAAAQASMGPMAPCRLESKNAEKLIILLPCTAKQLIIQTSNL
jgi:hypothetical protein